MTILKTKPSIYLQHYVVQLGTKAASVWETHTGTAKNKKSTACGWTA